MDRCLKKLSIPSKTLDPSLFWLRCYWPCRIQEDDQKGNPNEIEIMKGNVASLYDKTKAGSEMADPFSIHSDRLFG